MSQSEEEHLIGQIEAALTSTIAERWIQQPKDKTLQKEKRGYTHCRFGSDRIARGIQRLRLRHRRLFNRCRQYLLTSTRSKACLR